MQGNDSFPQKIVLFEKCFAANSLLWRQIQISKFEKNNVFRFKIVSTST